MNFRACDGRVALVFVPDEETGGHRGSGFLAATKRLGTHGIGLLTPEPTSGVVWKAPRFEMCPGLLEIRFYAEQGMPAYAYGPGLLSISHGPKEFVDTDRIVDCAAIYARVAASVLERGNQPRGR